MAAGADFTNTRARETRITPDLLPRLTVEDFKEPGVGLAGDGRRLPRAIAALAPTPTAGPDSPAPKSVARQEAEWRQVTILSCDLEGECVSTDFPVIASAAKQSPSLYPPSMDIAAALRS